MLAAKLAKIPVVVHESDVTPGLANKLALPFSKHIFTVFEQTLDYVPAGKATCTGAVIRPEIFQGDRKEGLRIAGLTGEKPVFIVMGGSQGSAVLNEAVRKNLEAILEKYEIIHLCGKGNIDESLELTKGYTQFEYVTDGLPHLLAASDYAVSRAGSNAIFELLSIIKPMLLIPLSASQSRGDQLLNASLFKSLGIANVIQEEELAEFSMPELFGTLIEDSEKLASNMKKVSNTKSPEEMAELILSYKN